MKAHCRYAAVLLLLMVSLFSAACAQGAEADASAETLTLTGDTAASLAFLADNAALEELTLLNCPAVDLTPLTTCKRLRSLTLIRDEGTAETGMFDLSPLVKCTQLRSLTLQGPCVADLTPLKKMQALTGLSVLSLSADDYTPVASMRISYLQIGGAPADQLAVIFKALGKRLESAVIADCTLTPEANEAILRSPKLLSLRFNRVSGIATGADDWNGLTKITGVQMTGCPLDGLAFLSHYIADVIVKLEDIVINGTVCSVDFDKYFLKTDNVPPDALLSFLGGSGCRWLYATVGMQTGTVSREVIAAFADIGSLLSLDVQAVAPDAWDAQAWRGFPKLEQLKMNGSGVSDAACLQSLTGLKRLTLSHTEVIHSESLGALTGLQQLSLLSCEMDGWEYLSRLASLQLFAAADCNGPASLDFVTALKKLEILAVENAPVTDVTPLARHSLESLSLYGCPIEDYAPLATLPNLFILSCNEDAALPSIGCRVLRRRMIDTGEPL